MIDAIRKGWKGSRIVGNVGYVNSGVVAATFNDVAGTWGSDVVGAVLVRASDVTHGSDELLRIRCEYWASGRER